MPNKNPFHRALESLKEPQGWCVSIVIHTERGFHDHKQVAGKFKEAVHQVNRQLEDVGDKQIAKGYAQRLDEQSDTLEFTKFKDGLGLFMDENNVTVVDFPFPVEDKAIVDRSFEVRDLLYGASGVRPYFVLMLGKEDARLYNGLADRLVQVSGRMDLTPEERIYDDGPEDWRWEKPRVETNTYHPFLHRIDDLLGLYLARRHQPFLVLGPDADINHFINHSRNTAYLGGRLAGSFDHMEDDKVYEAVAPLVADLTKQREAAALERLANEGGQGVKAQGLQDIWPLAGEGRVGTLLVERDYRQPGYSTEDGTALFLDPEEAAPVAHRDAVDDLAEKVIDMQGDVVFTDPGTLADFGRIAALLRY